MKVFSLLLALLIPINSHAVAKIVNADIAAGAAIAFNKMAASTANNVCTFNGSGFIGAGVAPGASGNFLVSNGTTWTSAASTAAFSIGALDAQTQNATGQSLVSNVLSAQSANATFPGLVNNTTQTFSGAKTFSSAPTFSTMTLGSVFFAGTGGLLSQDNSNFFWDATNHKLGIGTTTPRGYFDVINTGDSLLASPTIAGAGGSDNNSWLLYASSTGIFSIWNRNQLLTGFELNTFGNVALGAGASFGHPLATVLMANQTTATTLPTLVVRASGVQSADLQNWTANDETTILAKVNVTGAATFAGMTVSTLGTGIAHLNSSGVMSSSAVDLSGADATGILAAGRFPALTGDVTTSAGALATTLATVNGNVGSFTNASITVNGKGLITAASNGTTAVTSLTVATANGFAGSFTASATPVLTLTTTITGILSGNGTAISAASTTGSGSVVLATSPTITTPTIAKLANLTTNGFVKTSGGDGTLGVQTSPIPSADIGGGRTLNDQSGTTYTFILSDASNAGGFTKVNSTNGSASTFTVPPQSSVVWLAGSQIDVCQRGAGKLTIAAGSGVTIHSKGGNLALSSQYVCGSLVRNSSDDWDLYGDLIP